MKIGDLKNKCRTWVLGVPAEEHYLRFNASRGQWEWTDRLIKATSYPSVEAAKRELLGNPTLNDLLADDPSCDRVAVLRVGLYVMQEDM